jgi:type VI protein secretion system component Hcp
VLLSNNSETEVKKLSRKYAVLALAVFGVVGSPVTAQFTPAPVVSSMTLSVTGCSTTSKVNAWSWGESIPVTIGSVTTGKVSLTALTVQKPFDACSPILAADVAAGQHVTTATLTEYDNNKNVLMTMVLTTVFVEDYEIDGSTTTAGPAESVSFAMEQIQITYPSSSGNVPFCYNIALAKAC